MLILVAMIVPANCLAIYRYSRRKISRSFFVLAVSLCFNNFLMSILGTFFGLAKFYEKHPLEQVGCTITMVLVGGVASFTMLVQALISYERRRAVTSLSMTKPALRIYILLAIAAALPFGVWIIAFGVFEEADYIVVRTLPNSNHTITICNPGDIAFMGSNESIFALCGFLLPALVICFNYWPIWMEALRIFRRRFSISPPPTILVQTRKRQIRLAVIMSFTVMEFLIFYLPQFIIIIASIYQRLKGSVTLSHEYSTFGCSLWLIDSIINPLWTTFLWKQLKIQSEPRSSNSQRRSTLTKTKIWFLNCKIVHS